MFEVLSTKTITSFESFNKVRGWCFFKSILIYFLPEKLISFHKICPWNLATLDINLQTDQTRQKRLTLIQPSFVRWCLVDKKKKRQYAHIRVCQLDDYSKAASILRLWIDKFSGRKVWYELLARQIFNTDSQWKTIVHFHYCSRL